MKRVIYMKRSLHLILVVSFFMLMININSQVTRSGEPKVKNNAMLKNSALVKTSSLPIININKLLAEDEKQGIPNRYSKYFDADIDVKKEGTIDQLPDGNLYRYKLVSKNAFSIAIHFKEYNLPAEATLFLYNDDYSIVRGAFTNLNNKDYASLMMADFPGQSVIIEYFEPFGREGILKIGSVGQAYRSLDINKELTINQDYVYINCPEGDDWQLEKHAVAKMSFQEDGSGYICTGALINNVKTEGIPYFLTANHCISTNTSASTLVTYFNLEKIGCGGIAVEDYKSLSGATLRATHDDTDFTLLELDETPTAAYQPYYAGWDITGENPIAPVTIHHPGGNYKRIALEYDSAIIFQGTINWGGIYYSPPSTHWLTFIDKGELIGGSSGAPLFNSNKKIVGQLHGGSDYEFFGRIDESFYRQKPFNQNLLYWLDPDSTGVQLLDGYYPDSNYVDAHFSTTFNQVCYNAEVDFFNKSAFDPDSVLWEISPAYYKFVDTFDAKDNNISVTFDSTGTYDLYLTAYKDGRDNQQYKSGYITVANDLNISIFDSLFYCLHTGQEYNVIASGAVDFSWDLPINKTDVFELDTLLGDTCTISYNITSGNTDSIIPLYITGRHGECATQKTLNLKLLINDKIEHAYLITEGDNGPFTNYCASVEANEPNPVGSECNTQDSWCTCEVSDTILDNSVWFKFVGPSSGIVSINSRGFDLQMALYDASSYTDILSGNPLNYTILAANDDYWGEDKNYAALIFSEIVTPGKTYWLQVDGSACGAEGEFYLTLAPYTSLTDNTKKDLDIDVFYSKLLQEVHINNNTIHGISNVEIYNILGVKQLSEQYSIRNGSNEKIRVSTDTMYNGAYIIRLILDNHIHYTQKLIVY